VSKPDTAGDTTGRGDVGPDGDRDGRFDLCGDGAKILGLDEERERKLKLEEPWFVSGGRVFATGRFGSS